MCIAFWTCEDPSFAFVLASARDEYYGRPTSTANWQKLDDGTEVLCGLDLIAKGTWLAITKRGRMALLTNFTEPLDARKKPSRGMLVMDFLKRTEPFKEACQAMLDSYDLPAFAGFNMLLAEIGVEQSQFAVVTNRPDPKLSTTHALFDAVPVTGTIGNGHYHLHLTPDDWPKARNGLQDFLHARGPHPSSTNASDAFYEVLT
jgi:uncharacterized protein with NRDE domain